MRRPPLPPALFLRAPLPTPSLPYSRPSPPLVFNLNPSLFPSPSGLGPLRPSYFRSYPRSVKRKKRKGRREEGRNLPHFGERRWRPSVQRSRRATMCERSTSFPSLLPAPPRPSPRRTINIRRDTGILYQLLGLMVGRVGNTSVPVSFAPHYYSQILNVRLRNVE